MNIKRIVGCLVLIATVLPLWNVTAKTSSLHVPRYQDNGFLQAVDDEADTDEDKKVVTNVLDNDIGVDVAPSLITLSIIDEPSNGQVETKGSKDFEYSPFADFHGDDRYRYEVCLADDLCSTAYVNIKVDPVNDKPSASPDTVQTEENDPVKIPVLANDKGLGDTPVEVSLVTQPSHGTAQVQTDGSITYTPEDSYGGEDPFRYQVCDVDGECAAADISVSVALPDVSPDATSDSAVVDENSSVSVKVLTNDSGLRNVPISVFIETPPSHGAASVNTDLSVTYTPNAGYYGSDQYVYQVCDLDDDCDQADVTITINPSTTRFSAVDDLYRTGPQQALVVDAPGVLTNDQVAEGVSLTVALESGPSNGVINFNQNGSFTYTPNADFAGDDSFSYLLQNGTVTYSQAVVVIQVGDLQAPVLEWVAPVNSGERYDVNEASVLLEVSATDNQSVTSVRFFRWDALQMKFIEIGTDTTSPYQVTVNAYDLTPRWNQVIARASDASGNESESQWIWLYSFNPYQTFISWASRLSRY